MSNILNDSLTERESCLWELLQHVLLCGGALADCLKNKFSEKHAERVTENWYAAIESLVVSANQSE